MICSIKWHSMKWGSQVSHALAHHICQGVDEMMTRLHLEAQFLGFTHSISGSAFKVYPDFTRPASRRSSRVQYLSLRRRP